MRRIRGFSLIEVLIGLAILGLVVTVSLAVFLDRDRRLRNAEATILAYQAIANEIELYRHSPYASLAGTKGKPFQSSSSLLALLPDMKDTVRVTQPAAGLKQIAFSIEWNRGTHKAALTIVRSDTGGANLW